MSSSSSFSAVATFSSVTAAAERIQPHRHTSDKAGFFGRNRRVALVNNNNNNNSRRSKVLLAPRADASPSGSGEYGTVPRHNVAIGGHNPTGGDASMDEARVVDPYGLVGGKDKQTGGGMKGGVVAFLFFDFLSLFFLPKLHVQQKIMTTPRTVFLLGTRPSLVTQYNATVIYAVFLFSYTYV